MSNVKDLAKDRAQFAYVCAEEGKKVLSLSQVNNEYFKDDKYKSYVKKIPMMILTNGLGATFAFVYSKQKKEDKHKQKAGVEGNPKNGYDLIYKQVDEWLQKNYKSGQCNKNSECYKEEKKEKCAEIDLVKWIICLDSSEYRAVTNEVLALFGWLKRFADGMIEGEGDGE